MDKKNVSKDLYENRRILEQDFADCADILIKEIKHNQIHMIIAYIEVTFDINLLETLAVEELLANAQMAGSNDVFHSMEEAEQVLLTGDAILFVDGMAKAIRIVDKGLPQMDVQKTDSEKVIRGTNEGFTDSIKSNTALIRRRIRSRLLKVREHKMGVRTNTLVDIMYIDDLVDRRLLKEIEQRLEKYEIDGVLDSGVIEQLSEEKWYSPFPEFQTTQRPDRAAMALLEGRIVILSDNSPISLILPTDINLFIRTTDDYYNRFEAASFARIIRYVAMFLSLALPGLYLAVTNFHTQILPTSLMLAFWENRQGVPFPEVVEVILMEMSFELLREAGTRLPGAMSNTIGIVGGLIIGQAAVDAGIVSPIVVIIVAFTALCSFAIPSEEFAFSFRLLKFYIIFMSAWLGYFGFLVGLYTILIHLSKLKSFGYPYMMPFVGADAGNYEEEGDSIVRMPLRMIKKRPIIAQKDERIKLKKRRKN
ncbi:MAG: spore germination protein [Agathobacter sp.]|nr:spore germination protein [Agathobacter sp.]